MSTCEGPRGFPGLHGASKGLNIVIKPEYVAQKRYFSERIVTITTQENQEYLQLTSLEQWLVCVLRIWELDGASLRAYKAVKLQKWGFMADFLFVSEQFFTAKASVNPPAPAQRRWYRQLLNPEFLWHPWPHLGITHPIYRLRYKQNNFFGLDQASLRPSLKKTRRIKLFNYKIL